MTILAYGASTYLVDDYMYAFDFKALQTRVLRFYGVSQTHNRIVNKKKCISNYDYSHYVKCTYDLST